MTEEDIEVKTIEDLIQWCQKEVKDTEKFINKTTDEWPIARINAFEEVIMHLTNIKALEALV